MNQLVCKKCLKSNFQVYTDDHEVKVKCLACEDVQDLKIKGPRAKKEVKKKGGFADFLANGPKLFR